MAKPTLAKRLAEKSLGAAKAAIEIYNKPEFDYKMEAFVVLMINAWELLFKAHILKSNKNNIKYILLQDKQATKMLQLQQLGLHLPRLKYRDRWDRIKGR